MSAAWNIRSYPSGRGRDGSETHTIVAVSGCRVIRLDKQTAADILAFDPEAAWAGTVRPNINPEITDLAATA